MKYVFSTLLMLLGFGSIFAGNGSIAGKIIDAKTGETLIGATVLIVNTSIGSVSDIDGNYSIKNLAPGIYTIRTTYIGYVERLDSNIEVTADNVSSLSITMNTAEKEIKEVIVTAKISRDNTSAIVTMQKNSSTISSGISGEEIKRSPDRSSGDVIKRVSGATIQDNKFAIIRGLSDRYNYAMVNGAVLPSTEPDRKAFAFDMFPSNLLDNIIITKTAQPDLPAEFAGGIIQLNTRDIPEKSFFNLTIGQSFIEKATFKPYYTYKGGKTDFLGVDDGTRALPAGFIASDSLQKLPNSQRYPYAKSLPNNWGLQKKKIAYPGQSFQFSGGFVKDLKNVKIGSVASLSYSNSLRTIFSNRYDFNADGSGIFDYDDVAYSNPIAIGALLNLTFLIKNDQKISFKNTFNINSEDRTTLRTGQNIDQIRQFEKNSFEFTSSRLLANQIIGEHLIRKPGIKIKWTGGFSWIRRTQPQTRRMSYSIDYTNPDDTLYHADISNQVNIGQGGLFYSNLDEKIYSGGADVSVPFKIQSTKQLFKTGFYIQHKDRDFSARVMGLTIARVSTFDRSLLSLDQASIFDTANFSARGFNISDITNKSDKYTASADLYAGYAMFENAFAKRFKIVWGARFEYFRQQLSSFNYSNDTIKVDKKYPTVLPSMNFIYSTTSKSNFRVSYSMTLARPEFREISPFSFYDFNTTFTITGFDSLNQTRIHNADIRYEYFFGKGQMAAVSLYYKYFKAPIEQVVTLKGADYTLFSFNNASFAHNGGVEFEFRKNLDFISKWKHWEDFMFTGNFSYIYSKIDLSSISSSTGASSRPLQGQSPFVINASATYRQPRLDLSFTIMYNQAGRRLAVVGTSDYPDMYENSRPLLDFQISKKVLKNGVLKLTFSDLIAKSSFFYQNSGAGKNSNFQKEFDTVLIEQKNQRTYTLSFTYTFK